MNQNDFLAALEQELRLRSIGFNRADLLEFVADVWPLAQENPDVTFWAHEFLESGRGAYRGRGNSLEERQDVADRAGRLDLTPRKARMLARSAASVR